MSTATRFKHHRAFPFCAEHKTDAEIDAIANPSGDQAYLRWTGTLAQAMALWWNLESYSTTLTYDGSSYPIGDADTQWCDLSLLDNVLVPPRSRACFEVDALGSSVLVFDGAEPLLTIAIFFAGIYYNTTSAVYEVLISLQLTAGSYVIGSFYDFANGVTDPFAVSVFGQTFTLYSTDAATRYIGDVAEAYLIYT